MNTHREGFSQPDNRGHVTFTKNEASYFYTPPAKEGYVLYFTARHGTDFTRWSYRPMTEKEYERAAAKAYANGPGRTPTTEEIQAWL